MNEQQIADYVLGQMLETNRAAFEQALTQSLVLRQEVESLQNMYAALQSSEKETDSRLDDGFYKILEAAKSQQIQTSSTKPSTVFSFSFNLIFRHAATLAGFGIMFWLGRSYAPVQTKTITIRQTVPQTAQIQMAAKPIEPKTPSRVIAGYGSEQIASLQKEIKATQELLILGLLRNTSTADRLRGLDIVATTNKPNDLIISELLKILKNDESLNVRLSAIETLERFKTEPQIKKSFIAQLTETTEPFEQMSLIEALVQMKAKESLPIMSQLEKNIETNPNVRLLARNSIGEIKIEEPLETVKPQNVKL